MQRVFPALVILSSLLALRGKASFEHRAKRRTPGQASQSTTDATPARTGKHLNFSASRCKRFIPPSPHTPLSGHSHLKLGATKATGAGLPQTAGAALSEDLSQMPQTGHPGLHVPARRQCFGCLPQLSSPASLISTAFSRTRSISRSQDGQVENYSHTNKHPGGKSMVLVQHPSAAANLSSPKGTSTS